MQTMNDTCTAGVMFAEALATLRGVACLADKPLTSEILRLGDNLTKLFAEGMNALLTTSHGKFSQSEEAGCKVLAAALLMNPWQYDKLSEWIA